MENVDINWLCSKITGPMIYESPDGGKTIKSRPAVDHPIHILINGSIPLKIWYEIYGT